MSRSDGWIRFDMPDATSTEGDTVTLLICPVCYAAVPSGLSGEHLHWHAGEGPPRGRTDV